MSKKIIGALCVVILIVFGAPMLEEQAENQTADSQNRLVAEYPELIRVLLMGLAVTVVGLGLFTFNEFIR